jgi:quinol monooxygenase YgiN
VSVTAILEIRVKADALDAAYAAVHTTLVDTRAFEGCLGVDVAIDNDDPAHLYLIEKWESEERDAAYRAWRATPAGASDLGAVLTGRPSLVKLTDAPQI